MGLLAIASAIFFTRHDWEPAVTGSSSSSSSTSAGGSASTSAAACPSDVAATIPGGDGSTLIDAYQTTDYYVTLCQTTSGEDYYFGENKQDSSLQITLQAQDDNGTYTATNKGYTYQVDGQDLVVTNNGQTKIDQSLSPVS